MLRVAGLTVLLLASACAGTTTRQVAVESETTETSPATTSTTIPPDCASTLPSEALASQLLMVMVDDPSNAAEALREGQVGGFGLKGNQRSDVDEAIAQATADVPLPATVAVDEEGGPVQRLRYSAGRLPSAAEMAEGTPEEAAAQMAEHAARMAELGVTMNFAPVADLENEAVLADRTYSADPEEVGRYASAVAAAMGSSGITPVVKHWPGIGGAQEDPHESLPVLADLQQLRGEDMAAFDAVMESTPVAVMVAHAEVPGLTAPGVPASLSTEAITDELRGREGFDGVVITDSLGMGAIVNQQSQSEAAVKALAAGADIALLSGSDVVADTHARVTSAIEDGELPEDQVEQSVRRVLAMKGIEDECFDAISAYAAIQRNRAETADADNGSGGEGSGGEGSGDEGSGGEGSEVTDSGINDSVDGGTNAGDGSNDASTDGSGNGNGSGGGEGGSSGR